MDMSNQLSIAIAFGCIGVTFVAIALPLIFRLVPPNHFYGFRTPKTLSDATIWYSINRSTGIDMATAGIVIAIAAFVVPRLLVDTYWVPTMTAVVGVALMIVVAKGLWQLRKL
jgi:uncharacterized membrane protein